MRKLGILIALLAVVAIVVPAFCAETAAPTAKAEKGTVTKIAPEGELVVLNIKGDTGTETVYKLLKETKVTKGGKVISAKEILVTDKVTVTKKGDIVETVDVEVIPVKVPLTTKTGAAVTTKTGAPVTSKAAETKK